MIILSLIESNYVQILIYEISNFTLRLNSSNDIPNTFQKIS